MPPRLLLPLLVPATLAGALLAQEEAGDLITAPGLEQKRYIGPLRDAYNRIDPSKDGWESEALSAEVSSQLSVLGELLEAAGGVMAAELEGLAGREFSCGSLRPAPLIPAFDEGGFKVRRLAAGAVGSQERVHLGPGGCATALNKWRKDARWGEKIHAKLKLFRIEENPDRRASAQVLCTITSHSKGARKQINATWVCRWKTAEDALPELLQITVVGYEEVEVLEAEGQPLFSDVTASILGKTKAWKEQFLHNSDYWRLRLPRDFGLDVVANHGFAIGDLNGDKLEDLYVCQQGGLPNRLFLQNPDGTLTDYTSESKTGWLDYCASALIVDLDNDGDKDLVISQDFRILFMDNLDGKGHFELAFGIGTKGQTFSLAAADVDRDGLLDIYSCGYNPAAVGARSGAMGEPTPFHDANNGGANILWRNGGNWEFFDVTAAVGLDINNRRFSFCASWEDYDNDGDLDLYVANDYGRNCLYRNDSAGGKIFFREVSDALGVQDTSAGMSTNWADFNRDGWMDLYVSNMFSGAGNRITYQRQFLAGTSEKVREQFRRMARGNTLFQSDRKGGFKDVSVAASVTMGRWAWGSTFVDLNNDGWEDLLVANGFVSAEDTGDL
jgi:hypothetical protein